MGDLVAGLFLSYVLNSVEDCDIAWFPQLFFYIGKYTTLVEIMGFKIRGVSLILNG